MSTVAEEIEEYLLKYRRADKTTQNERRAHALVLCWKWHAIKNGIRGIDLEEAG